MGQGRIPEIQEKTKNPSKQFVENMTPDLGVRIAVRVGLEEMAQPWFLYIYVIVGWWPMM